MQKIEIKRMNSVATRAQRSSSIMMKGALLAETIVKMYWKSTDIIASRVSFNVYHN